MARINPYSTHIRGINPLPAGNPLPGNTRYIRAPIRGRHGIPGHLQATRIGQVQGVEMVLRDFDTLNSNGQMGARRGLRRAALFLLRESKKIVPVDTGALRASGRVVEGWASGVGTGNVVTRDITVYVVYTVYYALFVHEALHIFRHHGKLAKYVEIPLRVNQNIILNIIETEVRYMTNNKSGYVAIV